MILSVSHIKKEFPGEIILKDATFHIEEKEKAGLVGNNGAGKSTLFKIICGLMPSDEGAVAISKDISLGYLSQHEELISDKTVFDEVLSVKENLLSLEGKMRELEKAMENASEDNVTLLIKQHDRLQEEFHYSNGYAVKNQVTAVLKGLGFTDDRLFQPVATLSGGEKTRVALAKLLMLSPELLLLDEPTNHLDIHAITWLENYLLSYPGAVFIISHDRYFLDKVVTKIIDLDKGITNVYNGNYTVFTTKKKEILYAKLKEYENQQREIKHQEEVIERLRSYNREKFFKRAESHEKMLGRMEKVEKPTEENASMVLKLTPKCSSGNDVMDITGLSKSFDNKKLFENTGFSVKKGERIALIGDNGTGKSTLLKMITGSLLPDSGSIVLGTNVFIGYYDQEHQNLHNEKTIFEEISDEHSMMTNTEIRNMLAAFLFTGDDVYKPIGKLSGGERGRVSLAKLMLSNANFIILDEPTNHLDLINKEILENALNLYEGTLLFVSHDRYFINAVAGRIVELYDHRFINYIGSYDYYIEKKDLFHLNASESKISKSEASKGELDWKQMKEEQAKKRKAENDLKKIEKEIEDIENQISEIDNKFEDPDIVFDHEKLSKLSTNREALSSLLEEKMNEWEKMMI